MNDTSRPPKRRHSTTSGRNMVFEEIPKSGNSPPQKEISKRRSRSVETRPTSVLPVNESNNLVTSAAMDSTETLRRMSRGKEKNEIPSGGYPRSSSVPSTAKEEKKATKKSGTKSSRDLKKHKSRRHSIPADRGQQDSKIETTLTRESSTGSKKHRKPHSDSSSRSSKHRKQQSPKAMPETGKLEQSRALSTVQEVESINEPIPHSRSKAETVEVLAKQSNGKKESNPQSPSKSPNKPKSHSKAGSEDNSAEEIPLLDRDLKKRARQSRRSLEEASYQPKGTISKRKLAKAVSKEKGVNKNAVETAHPPPNDSRYKSSRRSLSSDPSIRRARSERVTPNESRVRSISSDGADKCTSTRPRRTQSEAAVHKRREKRIGALAVDAETAKEIAQRREALVEQQESEWVTSVGAGIQLEFGTDDISLVNEKDIEEFDADRSVHEDPINFLEDDPSDMTYGRRIAIKLMKYKWYNPKATPVLKEGDNDEDVYSDSDEEKERNDSPRGPIANPPEVDPLRESRPSLVTKLQYPSLARAWCYFEHVALPRYVMEPKVEAQKKNICVRMFRKCFCKASKTLDRAEPGENLIPTSLYSPIFTPLSQMGDFGLGIGLCFSTLRALMVLMLLAGLINIPNFVYFSGDSYSLGQPGVETLLKGSAICTNQIWVPCPTCLPGDFDDNLDRLATAEKTIEGGRSINLTFALLNDCDGATVQQGMINYGTLIFILIGIVVMNIYQNHMEIKYDEDEQTAQDYSIVIKNPPHDATDPEEWRLFFRYNFKDLHTTCCTIAVDNDLLVRALMKRRECMRKIEMLVEPGTSLDNINLARIAMEIKRKRTFFSRIFAMIIPGIPELYGQVTLLTAQVQGLAQQDYPVQNVFLTFETEAAQRQVLTALSVGSRAAKKNDVRVMKDNPTYLFRGTTLLRVEEPEEPSTVRWQDLNATWLARVKELVMTTLATFAAIGVIAVLIWKLHGVRPVWAALAIAVANIVFPQLAKLLTLTESHASESSKQTSLYFKIAFFRWVNTAIIITVITPFTKTLDNDEGLIESIFAIFFADIVTTNAVQFLDPVGHIYRHILAPRGATQDLMNLRMQGLEVELAERYTNMTKILFLALWYCSIFPAALFLCAFALFVNYFMDRFSLMRTWKRAPALGTSISKFSRKYFISSAVIAMAIVSSYYWASFRFDNLCFDSVALDPTYLNTGVASDRSGEWDLITLGTGKKLREITVSPDSQVYKYCLQDMFRQQGESFPAVPSNQPVGNEWMSEEQEKITKIYGWTSVAVLVVVFLSIIWSWIQSAKGVFKSTYEPSGEDQGINFSEVPSISTFVPQVESKAYSYPLLACKVDGVDGDLLDWTDPDHPFSFYDLTIDAEELLEGTDITCKSVFSTLTHWPPEGKKKRGSMRSLGGVGRDASGSIESLEGTE